MSTFLCAERSKLLVKNSFSDVCASTSHWTRKLHSKSIFHNPHRCSHRAIGKLSSSSDPFQQCAIKLIWIVNWTSDTFAKCLVQNIPVFGMAAITHPFLCYLSVTELRHFEKIRVVPWNINTSWCGMSGLSIRASIKYLQPGRQQKSLKPLLRVGNK